MSVLIYIGKDKPEKNLLETIKYKAYLSPEVKESIINDLVEYHKDIDKYQIEITVEIQLKKYNDTKNT